MTLSRGCLQDGPRLCSRGVGERSEHQEINPSNWSSRTGSEPIFPLAECKTRPFTDLLSVPCPSGLAGYSFSLVDARSPILHPDMIIVLCSRVEGRVIIGRCQHRSAPREGELARKNASSIAVSVCRIVLGETKRLESTPVCTLTLMNKTPPTLF